MDRFANRFRLPEPDSDDDEGKGDECTDNAFLFMEAQRPETCAQYGTVYEVKKHADSHQVLYTALRGAEESVFNDVELRKACSNVQRGRNTNKNVMKRLHTTCVEHNIYICSKLASRMLFLPIFARRVAAFPVHPHLGQVPE